MRVLIVFRILLKLINNHCNTVVDWFSQVVPPPPPPVVVTTSSPSPPPDLDRRSSSIAALRLKAREHELRLEMLRKNGDLVS